MTDYDRDEGPVPVEVLQARAAKAKDAELAAALQRAERLLEQRNEVMRDLERMSERVNAEDERAEKAERDLAAARGERDRLLEALEGALRLCRFCGGSGLLPASAAQPDGEMKWGRKPCPACTPFRDVRAAAAGAAGERSEDA